MVYTFDEYLALLFTPKYPAYIFLVSCETQDEKALLHKSLYKYFSDVHILLYTEEELNAFVEKADDKSKKIWNRRIIGQIFTSKKQATAAGVVMGGQLLVLNQNDIDNQIDLGEVFTRMFKEILDVQVYKCTHDVQGPENIPQEWRSKVRKFWADLVGDGYMSIDFTKKQIGN